MELPTKLDRGIKIVELLSNKEVNKDLESVLNFLLDNNYTYVISENNVEYYLSDLTVEFENGFTIWDNIVKTYESLSL